MSEVETILIRSLAHADAVRLPIRDWTGQTSANRTLAMPALSRVGVPVRVGGEAVDRKSAERLLGEMQTDGLILVTRVGRVKFPHVRLTEQSDARARALCGLPGRAEARAMLATVAGATDRKAKTMERYLLAEIALHDGKGYGDATKKERAALAETELVFCAAASAGWLGAHSDSAGRVYYAVTAGGWREIDAPGAVVSAAESEIDGAVDLYCSARDEKLALMVATKPDRVGEIGDYPLAASHHGSPVLRRRRV